MNLEPGKNLPFIPLYYLSATELKFQKHYLEDHSRDGLIRHYRSSVDAPMLFTHKKDVGLRLCIPFEALLRYIHVSNPTRHHELPSRPEEVRVEEQAVNEVLQNLHQMLSMLENLLAMRHTS